jgi:NDP-sugar pyrophosphorylase family protein
MDLLSQLFTRFPKELKINSDNIFRFAALLIEFLRKINVPYCLTDIDHGKTIIKNSYVDPSAYIGDFTLIRNSYISGAARIGAHVEINNSIVLGEVVIPHHNYIGYSIIGNKVILGGNTRTTVRRLDDKKPRIIIDGIKYCAECTKFGSIIGDNSKIGSSVIFSPLTILSKGVIIEPNITVSGFFSEATYVKNNNIVRGNNIGMNYEQASISDAKSWDV